MKRTPLEKYRDASEKYQADVKKAQDKLDTVRLDQMERSLDDRDAIIRVETDPNLSPEQRLLIFKGLLGWPRIVLGLYEAEREIAEQQKRENPVAAHGEPSDIACENVGRVVGLGADRIKALCTEGRRHLNEGMPAGFVVKMTAAEFERRILRSGAV